jgi:hypothetical protein
MKMYRSDVLLLDGGPLNPRPFGLQVAQASLARRILSGTRAGNASLQEVETNGASARYRANLIGSVHDSARGTSPRALLKLVEGDQELARRISRSSLDV